jgi:rhodanese-related sulfurtransferase
MGAMRKTLKQITDVWRGAIEEVGVEDLDKIRAEAHSNGGPVIIDVREPGEVAAGGLIPGAIHIPRGALERDIAKRAFRDEITPEDRERPVILYCAHGVRSRLAAAALKGMGFRHAKSLKGGIKAWKGAGRSVEK